MKEEIKLSNYNIQYRLIRELKYAYIKEGIGQPVFLLHGFPDHAGAWDQFVSALKQTNTCIAPFLRGYFPTGIPSNGDYSIKQIAEDIHLLANELGFTKYQVVGHDWGASVAYAMANLFPESVEKVVAIGMPHPAYLKPGIKLLWKARHILLFVNQQKAVERLSKNDYLYLRRLYQRWSPKWDASRLMLEMVYCFNKPGRKEAALGYYQELRKVDKSNLALYQQLPSVPTLTLVGRKDGTVDLSQFRKMESHSCFEVHYHLTAGHFLHREETEYCVKKLKSFSNKSFKTTNT